MISGPIPSPGRVTMRGMAAQAMPKTAYQERPSIPLWASPRTEQVAVASASSVAF